MKTIFACTSLIVLLCVSNVYCVENKYVQGTYYQNARVIKEKKEKLDVLVDGLVAKPNGKYILPSSYSFTKDECSEYFLYPIGKKYAVFSDSKYKGTYTIKGYSVTATEDGTMYYQINSDNKSSSEIWDLLILFNIDMDNIPREAKVRKIENVNTFSKYISTSGIDGRKNGIKEVYGIDIDKNGHEDYVILASGLDRNYGVLDVTVLTIVMNTASKPTILRLGNASFPFTHTKMSDLTDISFIDYDNNQPVLLSIAEFKAGSGWGGRVLYYFEKGQFMPLFDDFSYAN